MLVRIGASSVVSTRYITEPPAPGARVSSSGVHLEIFLADMPLGSSFIEIAQTSMRLPAIPAGAAIANPLAPGRPTEMPAASNIKVQEAMKRLFRRCCTALPFLSI